MVDIDGYYSNPNAKYLVYENPIDFGNTRRGKEREALNGADPGEARGCSTKSLVIH